MARLYAATGDGIARLDEAVDEWRVELFLPGSGAQCLAVDPADPDTRGRPARRGISRRRSPCDGQAVRTIAASLVGVRAASECRRRSWSRSIATTRVARLR